MNGFTIYKEYYELITLLTEKEQQEISLAIMRYMFENIEPTLNERQTKIFNNLKRPLDKSKNRGKSGSITKSNENQEENKTKSNENQNENELKTHQDVNVIVNVNDNVNGNGKKITIKEIEGIIQYLNLKTDSHYKYTTEKTQSLIKARINEGFTLQDFKIVIDNKCEEWLGTEFEKFLRPETLFSNKFEGYLNQKNIKGSKNKKVDSQMEILKGMYYGK